jgi:hypothetical protein
MSRSSRYFPACGITTCRSERGWKAHGNRKLRRASVRALLRQDPDALVMPVKDDVQNQYGPKDGRQHFDPQERPDLMRK